MHQTQGAGLEKLVEIAEDIIPAGSGYRARLSGEGEELFESANAIVFACLPANQLRERGQGLDATDVLRASGDGHHG